MAFPNRLRCEMRITVAQIGAREHYAVPASFHQMRCLRLFLTEVWVPRGVAGMLSILGLNRFAGRYTPALVGARVVAFPRLAWRLIRRRVAERVGAPVQNRFDFGVRMGESFALEVNQVLKGLQWAVDEDVFLGFTGGCLETLQLCSEMGGASIVDQVSPHMVEFEILNEERERWPGWDVQPEIPSEAYIERVRREWEQASLVLVNSTWSRDALVKQGVKPEKILVVPLAYEGGLPARVRKPRANRPLRVLWLGAVILRKGIQYVIEAARELGEDVVFRIVGPIGIAKDKVAMCPGNVVFWGPVARADVEQHYQWADVFVLPTLSDGFAVTQLEAVARGIPVIATRRCGDVVTDGVEGLIIRTGDAQAIVQAVRRLMVDSSLIPAMSEAAICRARQFTPAAYAGRVLEGVKRHLRNEDTESETL